jgi:molybdate transport system substrate-binding protein
MTKSRRTILLILLFFGGMAINTYAAAESLVVSAAASLKDAFIEAGKKFEKDHPQTKISFNFSSSNQLASQIEQGAPVDIFASADMLHIEKLVKNNLVVEKSTMAQNKLTVIVSKTTKMKIDSLADLSTKGLRLIMASKQIPVAIYTHQFLKKVDQTGTYGVDYSSRVLENTVSEEPDVRMVAMKVALGEGDMGIVYVSDVTRDIKIKVKEIAIADPLNIVAEYGISIIKGTSHPESAREFYNLLLSPEGQEILIKNGFLPVSKK